MSEHKTLRVGHWPSPPGQPRITFLGWPTHDNTEIYSTYTFQLQYTVENPNDEHLKREKTLGTRGKKGT
jgi:hypothetical protein